MKRKKRRSDGVDAKLNPRNQLKRRRRPTGEEPTASPLGGYMQNPPEDCPAPTAHRSRDDTYWVDTTLCVAFCGAAGVDPQKGFCKTAKTASKESIARHKAALERDRKRKGEENQE